MKHFLCKFIPAACGVLAAGSLAFNMPVIAAGDNGGGGNQV